MEISVAATDSDAPASPPSLDVDNFGQDVGQALVAVGVAEIFDKTWFLIILVALLRNKWVALFAGYLALAVHTGIAAAIGYGASKIPGLRTCTLDFITAGVLLLFAFMYAWEAYETDPTTDLLEEGREEAAEAIPDRKEEASSCSAPKEKVPEKEPVCSSSMWCLQCACRAPQSCLGGDDGGVEAASPAGATARCCCAQWPVLVCLRKFIVEFCGGGVSVASRQKDETDALVAKPPQSAAMRHLISFGQTFMVVFIAEWGDRTQIVMIGLHASHPVTPIVIGSLIAFLLLSLSAVGLSAVLATRQLNARLVRSIVAVSFFIFAFVSLNEGFQNLASGSV